MINKKYILMISFLVIFLSVSTVSAENITDDNLPLKDNYANNDTINGSFSLVTHTSYAKSDSRSVKEINITDSNYGEYFNVYTGEILSSADIIPGDTIRIGNVSDKAFTIDRKLILTAIGENDQITNGVIHLVSGSDGSTVTGLRIINDKTIFKVNGIECVTLHGIWLSNTDYNTISYNTVRVADAYKVFAMPMGYSSHNTIIYNNLVSTWSSCMPMGQCHYNNISNNYMQATNANLIYYNPYGHADYGGDPDCHNNYISNNYLYSIYASDAVIGMLFSYASHCNTTIINNTLVHMFNGIGITGDNATIKGNTLINMTSMALLIACSNVIASDNIITADHSDGGIGIGVQSSGLENIVVVNNTVNIKTGSYVGITIRGNSILVKNNIVNLLNYGEGIVVTGNNSQVINNHINTNVDVAINITGSNSTIQGNIIKTGSYGVYIKSIANQKVYFNSIINNTITSLLYGVYLKGTVYNTTISGNCINTNAPFGIYKDITDPYGDDSSDNIINDVIEDSTGIVVNDSNYSAYFDEDGYLKFKSFKNDIVIILTHLTNKNLYFDQKVKLTSNGLVSLLKNVKITLYSDAAGSIVQDLNFYNNNLNAIILVEGANNITILRNNITILADNNFTGSLSGISSYGLCEYVDITNNSIFINANQAYIYGINMVSYNFIGSMYASDFSKYFTISNNNIILIGNKLAEAIYTDSIIHSTIKNNVINIISGSYGYGISTANLIGSLFDLNITNNTIFVNARGMVYLIQLHMSRDVLLVNNSLWGVGSGVYGISAYKTDNVTIKSNFIRTIGGDLSLTDPGSFDVLGNGNAAVFLTANANKTNMLSNTFYTNAVKQLIFDKSYNTTLSCNSFVIDDENILNYFSSRLNGELLSGVVQSNDTLLLATLNHYCSLIFNVPLNLSSYLGNGIVNASFILKTGASYSNITGIVFNLTNNPALTLMDAFNVTVTNNTINISNIVESTITAISITLNSFSNQIKNNIINMDGLYALIGISISNRYQNRYGRSPKSNQIINNSISINSKYSATGVYVSMASDTLVLCNDIALASNSSYGVVTDSSLDYMGFSTIWTNNTQIINNTINARGLTVYLIKSLSAIANMVEGNLLLSNSSCSFGYIGFNCTNDSIKENNILLNGTGFNSNLAVIQAGIYYYGGASFNQVRDNHIISNYALGGEYAVFIDSNSFESNVVAGNYLISNNGYWVANNAVYALYDVVVNNTPYYVFVSPTGSDIMGNGTLNNPYSTIAYAISQAYNRAIIYLLNGTYHENGLVINKTLTIVPYEYGKVVLDGDKKQIFSILSMGDLTIMGLNLTNAYGENGSVFLNYGRLKIENSTLNHSTASRDGGCILNYGETILKNTVFSNNWGYVGGAVFNSGNLSIYNCSFLNNIASSGGAVFGTNSSYMIVYNSLFKCNAAITMGDVFLYNDTNLNTPAGLGGAISNSGPLYVYDSIFELNSALNGGAISISGKNYSTISGFDYWNGPGSDLYIINSLFKSNTAQNNGGAILGKIKNLFIFNSSFSGNEALTRGGALAATINNGTIMGSVFTRNLATTGGAIYIKGNLTILNSVISNNSAQYDGAVSYWGYSSYGHIQNLMTITNSTIEGNRALYQGGAFGFYEVNVNITNSNIVNNYAPSQSTFHTTGLRNSIYAMGNWWGSNKGPDDSVWNTDNTEFRNWLIQRVLWDVIASENTNGTNSGGGNFNSGSGYNSGNGGNSNPGSGTGSGIGFGIGTGSGLGVGTGSGIGNGDGTGSGFGSNSTNGTNGFSNGQSDVQYMSEQLQTVGSILTAAASSITSNSNPGGKSGGGSSGSSRIKKAYEIEEEKNSKQTESNNITAFIAVLLFLVLIFVGYLKNRKKSEF
ncbi:NosD domain-containing protein [Methanobacterium alcaliphilum]|uniref:NosD domain-containing protein n=1 Tax=Methanobacterium alcaliphilum TaxID=392018 RepID=UPI00200B24D3|nr:NosD domain-containing protein [Methanobacterium alcaliphilum]MCK9151553.1 hypothetical protein [Methanobacterium alcaliphilum]